MGCHIQYGKRYIIPSSFTSRLVDLKTKRLRYMYVMTKEWQLIATRVKVGLRPLLTDSLSP